jgi:hypothetical protein
MLARQELYHLSHSSSLFPLVILEIESTDSRPAWTTILLF